MALSVYETSTRLGITPVRVRQLIVSGELPAAKVGPQYVLQEADVERFTPRRRGHPVGSSSAWAFLQYLSGGPASFLTVSDKVRAQHARWKRDLQNQPPTTRPSYLAALVRTRATTWYLSADRDELPDLRRDPSLTISGVSHPEAGLLISAEVEAYIPEANFRPFRHDWLLVGVNPKEANVILHVAEVVPSRLPIAAVAADLAERRGDREHGQAEQILAELLRD